MVRVNNCTVSPLLGKTIWSFWSTLTISSFEAWARMCHSDLLQFGICLFPILLCACHCPPRNHQVSYPLLPLQMLACYLLNHCWFWHVSDFRPKVRSRVFCILQVHIHLERRKEDEICMKVRNHSDPSPCAPVINTLWTRKPSTDFMEVFQLSKHPVARVHRQTPVHSSGHVCQDTSVLWSHRMWIWWQNMHSRVNSLVTAACLLVCRSQRLCQPWEKHGGTSATVLIT